MCACQYHYNVSARCTCSCDSHGWRRRTQVQPEDKDDLYVETEPPKEGDWCLVWGQVDKVESPAGSFVSIGRSGERRYFAANAIVRPAAGQVPPWVKAEQGEAKAIRAIKTALVVDGGMHDDRYTQQTAESLYRAGIRATRGGAS